MIAVLDAGGIQIGKNIPNRLWFGNRAGGWRAFNPPKAGPEWSDRWERVALTPDGKICALATGKKVAVFAVPDDGKLIRQFTLPGGAIDPAYKYRR